MDMEEGQREVGNEDDERTGGADSAPRVAAVEEERGMVVMVVVENNEVFGPATCVDAMAEARLSPCASPLPPAAAAAPSSSSRTPPGSPSRTGKGSASLVAYCIQQGHPFRTRRWPIVYHGPSTTIDGKHWCGRGLIPHNVQRCVDVRLEAITDMSVICPIAQDSIVDADREAPFFPPGTRYSESVPGLNAVVLVACGHRFSALHLLYHWVRNMTVKCPVCRRGIENAHLRHSTLPTHLRAELLARIRRERRNDKEEEMRADMEAARLLAATLNTSGRYSGPGVVDREGHPFRVLYAHEGPRRFIPELGTFDPGDMSPLHVIMGYTIPLVDQSTSGDLLARADIIPSMAMAWATLPVGRGVMSPAYRAQVHRLLLQSGFGQAPQALVEPAAQQAMGEGGAASSASADAAPAEGYSLVRNIVYVDAFFSVIPWCLSRVSSACIELFLEHRECEGSSGASGGNGGGRDMVALFRHERLTASFGCRAGMWRVRGIPTMAMAALEDRVAAASGSGRGGEHHRHEGDGGGGGGGGGANAAARPNPPLLVWPQPTVAATATRATEAGAETTDAMTDGVNGDDAAVADDDDDDDWEDEDYVANMDEIDSSDDEEEEEEAADDNDDDDEYEGRFENEEVARILFSATAGSGSQHVGLVAGHRFRVAGGIDAMRFPPSEMLQPSVDHMRNGMVDLSPNRAPDSPLRYLVEMEHGVVKEVFFEVRLDLFCLLALEQEHVRQTALVRVGLP